MLQPFADTFDGVLRRLLQEKRQHIKRLSQNPCELRLSLPQVFPSSQGSINRDIRVEVLTGGISLSAILKYTTAPSELETLVKRTR